LTFEELEHAQFILRSRCMSSLVVNKYVQFVKYDLFIVFMLHMLYKNSKRTLVGS